MAGAGAGAGGGIAALIGAAELPPWEVVLKLVLLQTGITLLGGLALARLMAWRGAKRFPPQTSGAVLLTGTSSGIGRTAAVYLARKGFTVLAGVRKESDARALKELGEANIRPVMIDVAKADSVQACVKEVKALLAKEKLPFVGVINNAGLLQDATLEYHDMETMKHMFEVNYFGLVRVSQAFLPLLRASKGRLINVGSVAGRVSFPRYGAYAASKHAVEAASDALRAELTPAGVSVSLIQPGFCKTELFARGVPDPHLAQADSSATPPAAKEAYPHFYTEAFERKNRRPMENGSDPVVVCQAMHHALSDAYPKTRYPVAKINRAEVRAVFLVRTLMPDRLFDKKYLLSC